MKGKGEGSSMTSFGGLPMFREVFMGDNERKMKEKERKMKQKLRKIEGNLL